MDNQPWLDAVRKRLANYALPLSYAERLMGELADHLNDLKEEKMESDVSSRLGEPQQVVDAAAVAFRQRSFLGRHPIAAFLVFAISPVVSQCILMAAGFVAVVAAGAYLGLGDENGFWLGPAAKTVLPYVLSLVAIMVPSMILSLLYCILARRTGVGKKWMIVSCGVLAVMALMQYCHVTLYDNPRDGMISIGFFGAESVMQIVQFLAPLACGWWLIRRFARRQPELAS